MFDAIKAGKRVGAIYKEPTITPTLDQVKSMNLKVGNFPCQYKTVCQYDYDYNDFFQENVEKSQRSHARWLEWNFNQPRHYSHPGHGHGVIYSLTSSQLCRTDRCTVAYCVGTSARCCSIAMLLAGSTVPVTPWWGLAL
jgi:hypothetical protein